MTHSSGSSTVTSLSNSQHLSSSASSFSPARKASPEISKIYKHASELFLTRRLGEALSILRPIVNPSTPQTEAYNEEPSPRSQAPIATATTSQRIKIWNIYITVLSSISDLSHDEGATEVGYKEYKAIVSQVQDGRVWEQVIRDGYGGKEGSVDAEIVYNLTNLSLQHSPNQQLTQTRLENYLSSSTSPSLDISQASLSSPPRRRSLTNGTSTPRDLSSRLKILELFTLHVLPRNEEWEYARSFISGSDVLDDERRELFLQTLLELQEVHDNGEKAEELERLRKEELQKQRDLETKHAAERAASKPSQSKDHKRSSSEVDYGIETAKKSNDRQNKIPSSSRNSMPLNRTSEQSPPITRKTHPPPKPKSRQPPSTVAQVINLLRTFQALLSSSLSSVLRNPASIVKMFVGLVTILFVLGKKEVRDRLRRTLQTGWGKLVQTGKMGGKVTYI
ncbi:MAG: hypothetical protein Q9227_003192 [Pyrenula ochraceoflavens]